MGIELRIPANITNVADDGIRISYYSYIFVIRLLLII